MAYYDELTDFIRHDLKYLFLEPMKQKRALEYKEKKIEEADSLAQKKEIDKLMLGSVASKAEAVSKDWNSEQADVDRVLGEIEAVSAGFKDNPLLIAQTELIASGLNRSFETIENRRTSINELDVINEKILTGLKDENLSTDIEPLIESLKTAVDDKEGHLLSTDIDAINKQLGALEENTIVYNKFRELDNAEIPGFQTAKGNETYQNTLKFGTDYLKQGQYKKAESEFGKANTLLKNFKEDSRKVNVSKANYFDKEGNLLPKWEDQTYSYVDHTGQLVADMGIYDALIEAEDYQKNNMPKEALAVLKRLPKRIGLSNTAIRKQKDVDVLNVGAGVNSALDQITANRENLFSATKFGNKEVQDIFDRLDEVSQTKWDRTSTLSNDNFKKNIDQALTELANLGEGGRAWHEGWFDIDDDDLQTNLALWETAPKDPQEDINILTQSDIEKIIADDMEARKLDLMQTGTGSTFDWQQEIFGDRESYDTEVIGRMLGMLELRKEIDKLNSLIVQ